MHTVLFHSNQLGLRGTEVAMFDYAKALRTYKGVTPLIASKYGNEETTRKKFEDEFGEDNVIVYKNQAELEQFFNEKEGDLVYSIQAYGKDIIIPGAPHLIHCVFGIKSPQRKDRHKRIAISKFIKHVHKADDIIPHVIELPNPTTDYRDKLGIPKDAVVLGRYGGYDTFDIDFVKEAINRFDQYTLLKDKNLYFLFMNTEPFLTQHQDNVKFIKGTYDLQKKSNFINTCDVYLHARKRGETFGMSPLEFAYFGKPVISYYNPGDTDFEKNHIDVLKHNALYYSNPSQFLEILFDIDEYVKNYSPNTFKSCVAEFTSESIAKSMYYIMRSLPIKKAPKHAQ